MKTVIFSDFASSGAVHKTQHFQRKYNVNLSMTSNKTQHLFFCDVFQTGQDGHIMMATSGDNFFWVTASLKRTMTKY